MVSYVYILLRERLLKLGTTFKLLLDSLSIKYNAVDRRANKMIKLIIVAAILQEESLLDSGTSHEKCCAALNLRTLLPRILVLTDVPRVMEEYCSLRL